VSTLYSKDPPGAVYEPTVKLLVNVCGINAAEQGAQGTGGLIVKSVIMPQLEDIPTLKGLSHEIDTG
jgi:hypothetical protein